MASGTDDDGLSIVIAPAQLAAVLQGATLGGSDSWYNTLLHRVVGGAQLFAGAAELVGAGAATLKNRVFFILTAYPIA